MGTTLETAEQKRVTQKKLRLYAAKFLQEAYGIELDIPVVINGRLKSVNGRYIRYNNGTPKSIEISKNYIEYQDWELVISTLKHECIHHALFVKGLPFRDGEELFEAELVRHGSHSTKTIKYRGKIQVYKCGNESCGILFNRRRKFGSQMLCGACKTKIKYIGEKVI